MNGRLRNMRAGRSMLVGGLGRGQEIRKRRR